MVQHQKLQRLQVTLEQTGLSRTHVDRLEKLNLFPKRVKLNPEAGPKGAVAHYSDEIEDWINRRRDSQQRVA